MDIAQEHAHFCGQSHTPEQLGELLACELSLCPTARPAPSKLYLLLHSTSSKSQKNMALVYHFFL